MHYNCQDMYYNCQERMNPAEGGKRSVQLLYKRLCQPLSNKLHKMLIYGQTLSKQDGGAKRLMIHKNLPRNRAQCMCSVVLA